MRNGCAWRCLVVIGEALSSAVKQSPDLLVHVGKVHRAVARNRLVHAYFSLLGGLAWSILTDELPVRMAQVEYALDNVVVEEEEDG